MARPLRVNYAGAFYHVTSRGNERKNVFRSARDREKFLEYLSSSNDRYNARTHAYCLMDNHFHLLMETPSGNLPQIMRHINGAYTTWFNKKHQRSGHLFQGRYKAILVEKEEYAKELSRYIHLNPVRALVVDDPAKYEWSSFLFYIGQKKAPEWLYTDFILSWFGGKERISQKRYRDFVKSLVGKPCQSPFVEAICGTLLGSDEFIEFIKDSYLSNKPYDKDLPALKNLAPQLPMADIFNLVDGLIYKDRKLARNVKIYLSKKYTRAKLKEVGDQFGIGESGVSQVFRRICQQMEKDKSLRKTVKKIENKIKLSRMKT